jgi:hypothetical protein
MNTRLFLTIISISLFAIVLIGCASRPDNFTCTVNGVAFKVEQSSAKYKGGMLSISAILSEPKKADISINILADRPGTYICDENPPARNVARYRIVEGPVNSIVALYYTNSNYTGKIIITTFDLENMKVSGTFEFEAVQQQESPDFVNVKGTFVNVEVRSE